MLKYVQIIDDNRWFIVGISIAERTVDSKRDNSR